MLAVHASLEGENTMAVTWAQVYLEAWADEVCRKVVHSIRNGFPEQKSIVEEELKQFLGMKDGL